VLESGRIRGPLTRPASFDTWLAALEARHLANLTRAELTRSLRALSSCYVERRDRLARGAALEGAGKRAAFALFYAPLHFLTIDRIVRALGADAPQPKRILDVGCGTGAAGAAWALAFPEPARLSGIDRNPWAVDEANWTYRQLGIGGRARVGDAIAGAAKANSGDAILLAYVANELPPEKRDALLERLRDRLRAGGQFLIVEPIARAGWWSEWSGRLVADGARADEWRFPAALPPLLAEIAGGAGLDPRELTARSLSARTR
jgi:SAM-dependent methyltransferase